MQDPMLPLGREISKPLLCVGRDEVHPFLGHHFCARLGVQIDGKRISIRWFGSIFSALGIQFLQVVMGSSLVPNLSDTGLLRMGTDGINLHL